MISKLKTARKILREEGPRVLLHRARRFASKRMLGGWQTVTLSVATADVLAADWTKPAPADPKPKKSGPYRFNWVIPAPIGPGSGGHQNILRFARFLESKGHICRLYFYDPQKTQSQTELESVFKNFMPPMKATITAGADNMEPCDAIFATSWQTAYPVFSFPNAKKFYFVQDFEPSFYPVSSESILAENTYKFGFYGVTAGGWLTQKLKADYGMACDYYDFGSDFSRYIYENAGQRKKIIFYARPVTPRRGFELGVLALDLFAKQHPEYEINMVGWNVGDYRLPFKFVNHGVLGLDELNTLYNDAAAALVLSLTNMSLLPLELLSAGCIPVVNDAPNNRLVSNNPNIAYTPASPVALAERLSETVSRPDLPGYAKTAAASVQNLDWAKSGEKFEAILLRELHG